MFNTILMKNILLDFETASAALSHILAFKISLLIFEEELTRSKHIFAPLVWLCKFKISEHRFVKVDYKYHLY